MSSSPQRRSRITLAAVALIVLPIASTITQSAASAAPSTTNLVAHWTFDQTSGTVLTDSSGNGINGTLVGAPAWTAGRFGNGLSLTSGKYVSIGNIPAINGAKQVTIAAWIKRSATNSKVLLGKQAASKHDITIEAWNDGYVYFQVSNGTDVSGKVLLNDTKWHHLALVFDGTQTGNVARLKGYVDGVQRSLTFSGTVPAATTTNTTAFSIGKLQSDTSTGLVDDMWVYNRAVTAAEIGVLSSDAATSPTTTTTTTTSTTTPPTATTTSTTTTTTSPPTTTTSSTTTTTEPTTTTSSTTTTTEPATTTTESTTTTTTEPASTTTESTTTTTTEPASTTTESTTTTTTTAPPEPPTATLATDVTSTGIGGQANLSWSSTEANSCLASGGWSGSLATTGAVSISDIQSTTTYTLTCSGTGGQASSSATVTVSDISPPTSPTGLHSVTATTSTIDLAWNPSSDDVGVTGYLVFRGSTQVGMASATSFQDTGMQPGTAYAYTVKAVDAAGNTSGSGGPLTASTLAASGGYSLPLRVSADKRRFEDSNGKPFLMQGEAAWSLIAQLPQADVITYLDDRAAKGFNTLLVNVLEHKFATNAPNNIANVPPFTRAGDFSTPNEAYFANVDWVIQQAAQRGMVVLLTPSYAGYGGGDEGWYREMVANGATKLRNYGSYLGQRYGAYTNIIWVQGGDYNAPDKSLVDAIARGILDSDPDALQTAHGAPESNVATYWAGYNWMAINEVYTYSETYSPSLSQYQRNPPMPFIMAESAYENEHSASPTSLRTQAYHSLLAGAAGQIFGNNPIWMFGTNWKQQLASQGSVSMKYVGKLFNSRPWYQLVPDATHTTLTAGYGSLGSNYAAAARTPSGGTVIVYTPVRKALTINMTRVSGSTSKVWWFNPATGAVTSLGTVANTGSRSFTPPTTGDWVLVLDDASLTLPTPGS